MPMTVPNRPMNGAVEPTQRANAAEAVGDRTLRAGQRAGHPVVVDRIGQLAVLLLGHQRIFDDGAIGAALLQLVGRLAQVGEFRQRTLFAGS